MALPALPILGPQYEVLPRTLLDVASRLSQLSPISPVEDDRWIGGGVTWTPEPCLPLFTADIDACGSFAHTDFPRSCEPALTQTGFSVFDAFRGSALEYTQQDIEDILMGRITRKVSAVFATELLTAAISGDRALRKDATAPAQRPFNSAAVPVWYALAMIEDELARRLRGAKGFIHLPPGLLAQAVVTYGVREDNGRWYTPLGNTVVADAGYANNSGTNPTSVATPVAVGTAWIYGSGPIVFGMSGPVMVDRGNIGSTITNHTGVILSGQPPSAFGTRDNFTRFVDVYGILVFDPCPVTAVLASYEQTDVV